MNIMVNFFEKAHFKPLRQLFWKKLSISLIYSQKEKIWASQKQNSFVDFRSVWNGRGRLVWPHPFSKFEKKHITSFLDPYPGSVTNFTSFHIIWGGRVLAPEELWGSKNLSKINCLTLYCEICSKFPNYHRKVVCEAFMRFHEDSIGSVSVTIGSMRFYEVSTRSHLLIFN